MSVFRCVDCKCVLNLGEEVRCDGCLLDRADALEARIAELEAAMRDVLPCRACDGRGWQVTDDDTVNDVVQGTRECVVCEGSGIAS